MANTKTRKSKPVAQSTVEDPDEVPTWEPPTAVAPTAVVVAETPIEQQIMDLFNLPATGDNLAIKAAGYFEIIKLFAQQERRMALAMGQMAQDIHDHNLWQFYPGALFDSEAAYWGANHITFARVKGLLTYYQRTRPIIEAVGLDADAIYETSGNAAIAQIDKIAKQVERENPTIRSEPVDEATKTRVREQMLSFAEQPDDEVRRIAALQKGLTLKIPAYIDVEIDSRDPKNPKVVLSARLDMDTAEAIKDGNAFFKWLMDKQEINWVKICSMGNALRNATDVTPGSYVLAADDDGNMFDVFSLAS